MGMTGGRRTAVCEDGRQRPEARACTKGQFSAPVVSKRDPQPRPAPPVVVASRADGDVALVEWAGGGSDVGGERLRCLRSRRAAADAARRPGARDSGSTSGWRGIDARIGGDRVSSAGIVLDADRGLVLATAHAVWGATSLKVTTGLAVLHGRIVARDACDDLALVEVQPRLPGLVALRRPTTAACAAGARVRLVRRRGGEPAGSRAASSRRIAARPAPPGARCRSCPASPLRGALPLAGALVPRGERRPAAGARRAPGRHGAAWPAPAAGRWPRACRGAGSRPLDGAAAHRPAHGLRGLGAPLSLRARPAPQRRGAASALQARRRAAQRARPGHAAARHRGGRRMTLALARSPASWSSCSRPPRPCCSRAATTSRRRACASDRVTVAELPTDIAISQGRAWVTSAGSDDVVEVGRSPAPGQRRPPPGRRGHAADRRRPAVGLGHRRRDGPADQLRRGLRRARAAARDPGRHGDAVDVADRPGRRVGDQRRARHGHARRPGRQPRRRDRRSAPGASRRRSRSARTTSGSSTRATARWRRVDQRENLVAGRRVPVGRDPQDVAIGFGSVWVANRGDGTLTRVSERTGRPQGADQGRRGADGAGRHERRPCSCSTPRRARRAARRPASAAASRTACTSAATRRRSPSATAARLWSVDARSGTVTRVSGAS